MSDELRAALEKIARADLYGADGRVYPVQWEQGYNAGLGAAQEIARQALAQTPPAGDAARERVIVAARMIAQAQGHMDDIETHNRRADPKRQSEDFHEARTDRDRALSELMVAVSALDADPRPAPGGDDGQCAESGEHHLDRGWRPVGDPTRVSGGDVGDGAPLAPTGLDRPAPTVPEPAGEDDDGELDAWRGAYHSLTIRVRDIAADLTSPKPVGDPETWRSWLLSALVETSIGLELDRAYLGDDPTPAPEPPDGKRITPDQYPDLAPEQEARFLDEWGPGTQGHEALMYLADPERYPLPDDVKLPEPPGEVGAALERLLANPPTLRVRGGWVCWYCGGAVRDKAHHRDGCLWKAADQAGAGLPDAATNRREGD